MQIDGEDLMNERAGEQPGRTGNRAPVRNVQLPAAPSPPAQRNFQHRQNQPAERRGYRHRDQQSQTLPERHAGKLMFDEHIRKSAFDLPRLHLIVEFGDFGKSVGGDQPDLAGARIRHAHQIQIRFDIARRHGRQVSAGPAERLPAEFLRAG